MTESPSDLTQMLTSAGDQPPEAVAKKLMPLVYDELRSLAERYLQGERKNHTLQPTALVHEAFVRLVDQSRVDWQGRTHFFAVGASAMRRILIDHARSKGRQKRGGDWQRAMLSDVDVGQGSDLIDAIAMADALSALAAIDEQQARIVELRFFAGLTVDEVASLLGVSKRKVEGEWTHAKAWLRNQLDTDSRP